MAHDPLCPQLHERLRKLFGTVKISNHGQPATVLTVPDGQGSTRTIVKGGEYYLVNCPYCNDTRHRLWINHRFAEFPWLCVCYNEGCLEHQSRKDQLRLQLRLARGARLAVLPADTKARDPLQAAEWPGECVRLTALPDNHHALRYLRYRGFDPVQLAERYDIRYCTRCGPEWVPALGRLIIPVYWDHKLVGWQAREVERSPRFAEKYWTMPGMPRRDLLYNFDQARAQPYVVICEGPTDVWRIGPSGVALFGKSASMTQVHLLQTLIDRRTPILVMLDGDAAEAAKELTRLLAETRPHGVLRVELLPDQDPGGLDTDIVDGLVAEHLARLTGTQELSCSR